MGEGSGTGVFGGCKSSYRSTCMASAHPAVNPHACTQIKVTKIKTQREAWRGGPDSEVKMGCSGGRAGENKVNELK